MINKKVQLLLSIFLLILTGMIVWSGLFPDYLRAGRNPTQLALNPDEQAWLEKHPVIRVAPDPEFPPFEEIDKDGVYTGIAADYLKLLEERLPITFEVVHLKSWSEALEQIKTHKVDMLGAAVPTPDRLKYLRFTSSYTEFPAVVLVRDSAVEFPALAELTGKRVAVVADYADHEYMVSAYPQVPLEVMPDVSSGLRQLSFGKVDAMILNMATASYYIQKDGITNLKVTADTDFVYDFSFAGRSDWPYLISILEKGVQSITPEEKNIIFNKWISLGKQSWRPSPLVILSGLAVILLIGMFSVLYVNRMLKRQVQERTADLETELAERLQVEKEKQKLQQQVFRANKMEALGLLAGGVAHDLNNILTGTVGYSELAMLKVDDDDIIHRYLREIRDSGKRAGAVVADLLTMSRDTALDKQVVNLNKVLAEYWSSPEHKATEAKFPYIRFTMTPEEFLWNVSCSIVHVKKSIMSLVLNGAEATQSGSVTVETANKIVGEPPAANEPSEPGRYVVISVIDDGPGVSPEDLEHIFEPFYTRKKMGHSGTGLGLAIVWNSIQEHGGKIDIRQDQFGTRFDLYFPASTLDEEYGQVDLDETDLQGHGEHILVVDDEEQVRELACELLTHLGYRVSRVGSGEEAVKFLRSNDVDLLLLDMIMDPGMNGYQTYREIITFIPGQKALISSGFSESREVKKAHELGAGGYLMKPYTRNELGLAVKKELARSFETAPDGESLSPT